MKNGVKLMRSPITGEGIFNIDETFYEDSIISYSTETNTVGIASTIKDGVIMYHVYQTNEHGVMLWNETYSTFKEAHDHAIEEYECFQEYLNIKEKNDKGKEKRTLSDEDLWQLAIMGNNKAKENLMLRYDQLINNYVCTLLSERENYVDDEDLIQEGRVALLRAIQLYMPDKKCNFHDFAEEFIKREMLALLLSEERYVMRVNSIPKYALVLNKKQYLSNISGSDLELKLIRKETIRDLISTLPESEAKILNLYLNGFSYSEIAKRISLPSGETSIILRTILRKLG